jgi:PhnB protein
MKIIPYLYFNGNARSAFNFYVSALNAVPTQILTYGEGPGGENFPDTVKNLVMHTELILGDDLIYISDATLDNGAIEGDNIALNINCDSDEQITAFFTNLSKDAKEITAELEDTFWGAKFGSLVDQFGISWSLNFQHKA